MIKSSSIKTTSVILKEILHKKLLDL